MNSRGSGIVAGGNAGTVAAAADVLAAGGNAVDALVAGCLATSVCEPTLTSYFGGGAMLVREPGGEVVMLDFFVNAPGLGAPPIDGLDFQALEIDFGPARQEFQVGRGAAAVPGALVGMCTALSRWGRVGFERVIAPACEMMRAGYEVSPFQGKAAQVLEPIVSHGESGRARFRRDGRIIRAGDIFALPELADMLEELVKVGWRRYLAEVITPQILADFGLEAGGRITAEDLASYKVQPRVPLVSRYRGNTVYGNPAPALGGAMLATMLTVLDAQEPGSLGQHASDEHVRALAQAMRVADAARADGALEIGMDRSPDAPPYPPSPEALREMLAPWVDIYARLRGQPLDGAPAAPGGPGSTTHVSVIDGDGMAAAATFSHGEGCGHMVGGFGAMMNNMMGERDLHPDGWHRVAPGTRLRTMMSPTLVEASDGTMLLLGSGGANRIRTALLQVISNLVDFGLPPERAVQAPRVHFEAGVLCAETFEREDGGASLHSLRPPELTTFEEPNLFFGGVHMVRRRSDGQLDGAGDHRRGGEARLVRASD